MSEPGLAQPKTALNSEQPAVQMIQVDLGRVLRKGQQKVVLCVPLKAPLKGSGSLVALPLWDSTRTESPSMHPALPASEPQWFTAPPGHQGPIQCSFKLSGCKLSWFRSYFKAAQASCSKEKAFWQSQHKSFAIHESNPWNVLDQQLKMGHKETRHCCLLKEAANSTGLLHLLAKAPSAFSAMAFPPSLPFSVQLTWGCLKQQDLDPTGKPTQEISHCPRLPDEWKNVSGIWESH